MSLGHQVVQQILREVKSKERMKRMEHRKSVGSLLSLILASGMTQEAIAEELGLCQAQISRYLHKQATPKKAAIEELVRLAKERNIKKLPPMNGWAKH
jgi:DNA-binding transcriptional regulator LsrR (DeoR family)